ncbi:MAG: Yip1 family protein [Terriglobia bacterium]
MTEEMGAPKPMSEIDRLIGVLFDPKPAFADVAARPRWWVPLILLGVLALGFTYAYTQRVGWERFMRQQLESSPQVQQMSAEQREQMIQQQTRFAPVVGYVFGVLGWPFITLVSAGAFLLVFNVMLGTRLSFRAIYGVTCYGMLPHFLAGVLAVVVMFLKDPADFDLENPLATNIGAFLDPNTVPRWLISLGSSIDVFTIWSLVLLATGLSVAARKLAWSKAFTWVVAVWGFWLVVKTGWVWIFS